VSQLLAGSELVQIDEDELLEELEALTSKSINLNAKDESVFEIDGENIELPSVPKDSVKIRQEPERLKEEHQKEKEKEKEKILLA
jgi:hypothetical protein